MSELYIADNEKSLGPFRAEDVREMVRTGAVHPDDLVWREGMADWLPLRQAAPNTIPDTISGPSIPGRKKGNSGPAFLEEVFSSFIYPVRGDGLYLLITGSAFLIVSDVLAWLPIIGGLIALFVIFYFTAFLFNVIQETAIGENELPCYPGIESILDDIMHPFALFLVTFAFYLAPALGYLFFGGGNESGRDPFLFAALFYGGLFCIPMALLRAVVMNNALDAINIVAVFGSIARTLFSYLLVFGMLAAVFALIALYGEGSGALPWYISYPLGTFVLLYFAVVLARLIGIIYLTQKKRLGWLE